MCKCNIFHQSKTFLHRMVCLISNWIAKGSNVNQTISMSKL